MHRNFRIGFITVSIFFNCILNKDVVSTILIGGQLITVIQVFISVPNVANYFSNFRRTKEISYEN